MAGHDHLPAPTFDVDAWSSNYEGLLLPFRFAHAARRCPPIARQAVTAALAAAQHGQDTQLYLRVCELARCLHLLDLAAPDQGWVARQDEANRRERSRLEGELRGYKNNLIRESIRMGQEDLATHLLLTGGPPPDASPAGTAPSAGYHAAYQAFGKMRDYCTTPSHVASMTVRMVYAALVTAVATQQAGGAATMHFNTLVHNAGRLRTAGVKDEEQVKLTPVAHVAAGIAQLGLGNYRDAALSLLGTPFDYHTLGPVHGTDFGRVMASGNDVAIYGGLTALAVLSRQELVDAVLGGSFRPFLELEPHLRKAISLYTTAKYQACLATLQRYYSDWSLDVFLGAPLPGAAGSRLDRLLARIREKSMTAHFSSFSRVSLASLASTFPPPSAAAHTIEEEVLRMIASGQLNARLDAVDGLLIAPQTDARARTHADAQAAAEELERTLLLRLHKVNTTLAGLDIPRTRAGPGAWEGMHGMQASNGVY